MFDINRFCCHIEMMCLILLVLTAFLSLLIRLGGTSSCPPLSYVELRNGRINATDHQTFYFKCNVGYFLGGPDMTRCYKGNWTSEKKPVCYESEGLCDPAPDIPNADKFEPKVNKIGSEVNYMCHSGFVMLGDGTRKCLNTGSWSGTTPSCMNTSESLQTVADRLEKEFLTKMASYSKRNIRQQAYYLDKESLKNGLELVVLIDRSSSVDPVDMNIAKDFISYLLTKFNVRNGNNENGTRAAVIAFGTNVDIIFNVDDSLIDSPSAAKEALNRLLLPNGGGTAMVPALTAVFMRVELLLRPDVKRALFLISDGEPNVGSEGVAPEDMAKQLKEYAKFEIFAVGIGPDANRQLLATVVTEPVINHLFILKHYRDFRSILAQIENRPEDVQPINPEKCGHLNEGFDQWPWMGAVYVSIPNENSTQLRFCAGVLICSEWVLTAASCFFTFQGKVDVSMHLDEVFVVLGEKDLLKEDPMQTNFYADRVIVHREYDPSPESVVNNLALVELSSSVDLDIFRPVCLPPTDRILAPQMDSSLNASVAGWGIAPPTGNTSDDITAGQLRFQLDIASVSLAEERECLRTIQQDHRDDSIFCADTRLDKTCLGILGSPIVMQTPANEKHHLLGILTSRKNCKRNYSLYTKLRPHIPWINEMTKNCHFVHYN